MGGRESCKLKSKIKLTEWEVNFILLKKLKLISCEIAWSSLRLAKLCGVLRQKDQRCSVKEGTADQPFVSKMVGTTQLCWWSPIVRKKIKQKSVVVRAECRNPEVCWHNCRGDSENSLSVLPFPCLNVKLDGWNCVGIYHCTRPIIFSFYSSCALLEITLFKIFSLKELLLQVFTVRYF